MWKVIDKGICAPIGFKANGMHCGIRKNKTKKDLSLIYSDVMCNVSCTYTLNKVKGAPIYVTKENIQDNEAQAVIVNSGNANTCNANGIEIATEMCELCADALSLKKEDIIVASTGVIGETLCIDPIKNAIPTLVSGLSSKNHLKACEGIMTTDTYPKEYAISFTLGGKTCKIGGIAKGSGMIHPNMATMLCFISSDVQISKTLLDKCVHEVVDDTFNMISVDGDTSTNDMLSVMCNGLAENPIIDIENEDYKIFKEALYHVCETLSKMLAKDGEGATKLLTCYVKQAKTKKDARAIAKSIICSSLFKSAMFGCDANWGRILCAIGYAPADCEIDKVDVSLKSIKGEILLCVNGKSANKNGFDEEKAYEILKEEEIDIIVDLKDGKDSACAWGCDLTYDYVKINGDYRS